VGYFFLEWATGFPTSDFSNLKSYLYIATAGANIGVYIVERYVL